LEIFEVTVGLKCLHLILNAFILLHRTAFVGAQILYDVEVFVKNLLRKVAKSMQNGSQSSDYGCICGRQSLRECSEYCHTLVLAKLEEWLLCVHDKRLSLGEVILLCIRALGRWL